MSSEGRRFEPRKRPRQQRSERTRERILEAAVKVFTEYGYARGTTNRIAEWADISIGSLYQYYPNKDAIVVELASRHLDAGIANARRKQDFSATPTPMATILRTIVAAAIDSHTQDPAFLRVLIDEASRSGELMERVAQLQDTATADMRQILEHHPEVTVTDTATRRGWLSPRSSWSFTTHWRHRSRSTWNRSRTSW